MNTKTVDGIFKIKLSFTGKNDNWSYRGNIFHESTHKKSVKKSESVSGGNMPPFKAIKDAIDDAKKKIIDEMEKLETDER